MAEYLNSSPHKGYDSTPPIPHCVLDVLGIFLMQVGAVDIFQEQPKERNLKKELLMGFVSSAVDTLVILALIQFKIIEVPVLFFGA